MDTQQRALSTARGNQKKREHEYATYLHHQPQSRPRRQCPAHPGHGGAAGPAARHRDPGPPHPRPRPRHHPGPLPGRDRRGTAPVRLRRRRHHQRGGQRHRRFRQRRHDRHPHRVGQRLPEKLRSGRREIQRPGTALGRSCDPAGSHRLQWPALCPDLGLQRHRRPGGGGRPQVQRPPPPPGQGGIHRLG